MDKLSPSQKFDFFAAGLASGSDDAYSVFMGPPPKEAKINNYSKKNTAKFNMPENYIGTNEQLAATVEDMTLTAKWDFWTEKIMPWYRTDNIHFQWTEWNNNPHYMGITPHQTTSKVVTQKRTIRKASIKRYGIAAEFELDFVTTPLGRSSYSASLVQMSRAAQETGNMEVLRALLYCHRSVQVYIRKNGVVADGDLDAWLERKSERFMIAQKTPKGLERLNTMIDQDMEAYGGVANTWILSRDVMDYCDLVPEDKIFYFLGGQDAVDRVDGKRQNPAALGNTMGNVKSLQPTRMIGDVPVYLAKSLAHDGAAKLELLSRSVEIGIYNTMFDRTRDYSRYKSDARGIRVYDNDIDGWSDISLVEAIENAGVWDEKGELADVFSSKQGRTNANSYLDAEYDFLSYVDDKGQRKNIEFVGDMSVNFLNAANLENAGQTLLNALAHHDPVEAKNLTSQMDKLASNARKTNGAVGWNALQSEERDQLESVAYRIINLVGKENIIFTGSESTSPGESLFENFVLAGYGLATKGKASVMSQAGSSAQATEEQTFLVNVLGAPLDAHKVKVEQIASNANVHWTQRAKQLKELLLTVIAADPSAVPSFKDEPSSAVDNWYNKRVADFTKRLQDKFPALSVQSQAVEEKYFPVDAPLPAGWTFVRKPANTIAGNMPAFASIGSHNSGNRMVRAPGARGGATPAEDRARDSAYRNNAPKELRADYQGSTSRFFNLFNHIEAVGRGSCPLLVKWLATIYAGCRVTRERLSSFARNHIYVCLGFILFRSHCAYKTLYGIKVAAGGKAGYTMFGHSNMMIEHEAARKVGMMHYTAYLTAVVMYPKNVYVVEDMYCKKYLGGMGVEFWSPTAYKNATSRRDRSIICAPVPPNFKKVEKRIDMRGRWYTEHTMGLVTKERYDKPLYPGAGRMCHNFGLYDASRRDKQSNRGRIAAQFVCAQGMEWYFNPITGQFDDFTTEKSPFGNKVYPGCGQVRNGELMFLEDPAYNKRY
jgi:hypothetical protein